MSITLTYEGTLSRVKVVADGTGGDTVGLVERSPDQVQWSTVRGGLSAPVVGGSLTVYDYEFSPDVPNYYRVTTMKDVSFIATGAGVTGNNASLTPSVPGGGTAAGDVLLLLAAIRNVAGRPNAPAGYSLLYDMGNMRLFGKVHSGSESNPTVTFTGGVANADTLAQMASFRNIQLSAGSLATPSVNASAQNITYPAITTAGRRSLVVYMGTKQAAWTSVATLSGCVELGDFFSTAGDDAGLVWDSRSPVDAAPFLSGSFTVTGGSAATSLGGVAELLAAPLVQTASITPTIGGVWLKSIRFPFLNRQLFCATNISPITRRSRTTLFDVIGRSFPVAVGDVRRSRELSLDVVTQTKAQYQDLDFALASGDQMYLQPPASYPLDPMYVSVGDVSMARPLLNRSCGNDWRVFTLPLTEVAAPGPDVVGSTVTWQGVLNAFATWQDVVNAKATWFDLLQSVGTPADVIVP